MSESGQAAGDGRKVANLGTYNLSEALTSGNFTFRRAPIEGVIVVDVKSYGDERGAFMETYQRRDFAAGGITCDFVQDNQSSSVRGVLRGLHYQIEHPQSKLVRVIDGRVFDVAVDLREESPTFGRWFGVELSGENHRQLFIPHRFAHGFLVLSETAVFAYKCDDFYHPGDEGGIRWDDPDIAVSWPDLDGEAVSGDNVILSEKDRHHPGFADFRR